MLEHIIGGAGLQGLDRGLLAQGPGDKDKGQVGAALAGIGEGREAIVGGEPTVREDEGEAARFQRRDELGPGLDTGELAGDVRFLQERLYQLRVRTRCLPDRAPG